MIPDKFAEGILNAWEKSSLREELAGLIADEKVAGDVSQELKDHAWNSIGEWAVSFIIATPGLVISEENIRIMKKVLLEDVIYRTKEILNERGYKDED